MPTDYDNMIKWDSDSGGNGGGEEQDYLSKLAQSILKKDRKPAAVPTDRRSSSGMHRLPPSAPRPHQQTRAQMEDLPPPSPPPLRRPQAQAPQPPVQPQQRPSGVYALPGQEGSRGWRREVDLIDSEGKFLPGTIVVFEDGTLGIQKEYQSAKDYDIVYQLLENGRAVPQGIPLHNYEVEPIGRLGQLSLDHLVKTGHWERDALVFHLLKFKDVAYVPHLNKESTQERQSRQSYIMPKLTEEDLKQATESPAAPQSAPSANHTQAPHSASPDKPQRGMKMIIDFGPGRSWNAIYWGKDELGHVVAHNTHDKWSLMHLDLERFKDTIQWGDRIDESTVATMSKDFENQ